MLWIKVFSSVHVAVEKINLTRKLFAKNTGNKGKLRKRGLWISSLFLKLWKIVHYTIHYTYNIYGKLISFGKILNNVSFKKLLKLWGDFQLLFCKKLRNFFMLFGWITTLCQPNLHKHNIKFIVYSIYKIYSIFKWHKSAHSFVKINNSYRWNWRLRIRISIEY